jgi:hypothetical protein
MSPLYSIRLAMLGGVLLFGGACWMLQRAPDWSPSPNIDLNALRMLARALWALAITGVVILILRARRETHPARLITLSIVAWALGEMVALYGGVVYFLTGNASWYVAGVIFLALLLTAMPAPRARR